MAGVPPAEVWRSDAGRGFTARLVVEGSTLYGGGYDRRVYAVALESGETRWSQRLNGAVLGGVLKADSAIFVATGRPGGTVFALRADNGDELWNQSVGTTTAPPAIIDSLLIVHTQEGRVIALTPSTGTIRWRREIGRTRYNGYSPGRSSPVPAGAGYLMVTTIDSAFRLRTVDGTVVAQRALPGAVLSSWLPIEGQLIGATTDSSVISIDPTTLALNWSVRLDAPVLGPPAIRDRTLYAVSRIGTLYRIPLRPDPTAEEITTLGWAVTTPPVLWRGLLVLGGADGTLRAFTPAGTEVWRVAIWRPVEVAPVALPDALVAVGANGDVHRYEP